MIYQMAAIIPFLLNMLLHSLLLYDFRIGYVTFYDQWNVVLYNFWAQTSRGFAASGFNILEYFSRRTMWKCLV